MLKLHSPFLNQWEKDPQLKLKPAEHAKMLLLSYKSSISNKYQELGYKLITRWYQTPARLHAVYLSTPVTCWRCGDSPGFLILSDNPTLLDVGAQFHYKIY